MSERNYRFIICFRWFLGLALQYDRESHCLYIGVPMINVIIDLHKSNNEGFKFINQL